MACQQDNQLAEAMQGPWHGHDPADLGEPVTFPFGEPGDCVEDQDAWIEARAAEHLEVSEAWEARRQAILSSRLYDPAAERPYLRRRDTDRDQQALRAMMSPAAALEAELHGVADPAQLRLDGFRTAGADPGAAGLLPGVSGNNWLAVQGAADQPEPLPPLEPLPHLDRYPSGTWLGAVERLTDAPRGQRARMMLGRARAASRRSGLAIAEAERTGVVPHVYRMRRGRKVLVPTYLAERAAELWALHRAKGQRVRFESLLHCGEGALQVRCTTGCGHEQATTVGCANRRLCPVCRDREAARQRDTFMRARDVALKEARKKGLLRPFRARSLGGRYTEKHLTLTIPDQLIGAQFGGATEWRIAVLFAAWRTFSQHLQAWLRTSLECPGEAGCGAASGVDCEKGCGNRDARRLDCHWLRAFEWTAGSDLHGHPHFHVWLLSPFLPEPLLRFWWAQALQAEGVDVFGPAPAREARPASSGREAREAREARPDIRARWLRSDGRCRFSRRRLYSLELPELAEVAARVVIRVSEVKVRRVANGGDFAAELVKGGGQIKGIPGRTRLEVRRVRGEGTAGEDLVGYFLGWMVSETDSNGIAVGPDIGAAMYEALEGRRQNQAARGFMGLGKREAACPCCGTVGHLVVEVVPWFERQLDLYRMSFGLKPVRGPTAARASPGVRRADSRDRAMQLRLSECG